MGWERGGSGIQQFVGERTLEYGCQWYRYEKEVCQVLGRGAVATARMLRLGAEA